MREFILENLANEGTIDLMTVLLNNLVALVASFFIIQQKV